MKNIGKFLFISVVTILLMYQLYSIAAIFVIATMIIAFIVGFVSKSVLKID